MKKQVALSLFIFCSFIPTIAFCWNWEQTGPEGGYFKDFATHPNNPEVIYVGSDDSGGLWKTIDGGFSWTLMTADWPDMTAWQIELDPNNPEILYICDPYSRYGLLKSENGGENWAQITNGLTSQASRMVSRLIVDSSNSEVLYISTGLDRNGDPPKVGDGIYRSIDAGQSWSPYGLQGYTALTICETGDNLILAGLEDEGLFSTIDGFTWSQVAGIPDDGSVWHLESKGNVVAAAVHPYGVFLSFNSGQSFELSYSSYYVADVSIARVSPDVEIYATDFPGFIKYTSSTGEWESVVSPPLPANLMIMGLTALDDRVFCGAFANSAIFVSDDGASSWSQLPSAPQSGFYTGLAIDPNNPETIFAANLGSYMEYINLPALSKSDDGGETWTRVGPEAHAMFVDFSPGSSSIMYCGTFRKGAYRSEDCFESWEQIRTGDIITFDLAVDQDNPSALLLSEWDIGQSTIGVYRSVNSGETFQSVLPVLCSRLLNLPGTDVFYAATFEGLYESLNQGETWNKIGLADYNLISLAFGGEDCIYAGAETGELFQATGSSINNITGPWNMPIKVSGILYLNGVIYVGLDGAEVDTTYSMHGGVWRSFNGGESWENLTEGLQVDNVYGNSPMAFSDNALLVSTYGGGIQRLPDLLQIESCDIEMFSELTVTPNPSSNIFYFTVVTENPHNLTASIRDLYGREIRQLSNIEVGVNSRVFSWDCKNANGVLVPPGVYFCSVNATDTRNQSCRVVVSR